MFCPDEELWLDGVEAPLGLLWLEEFGCASLFVSLLKLPGEPLGVDPLPLVLGELEDVDGVLSVLLEELLPGVLLDPETLLPLDPELEFVSLDMLEPLRVALELFMPEPLCRDAADPEAVPDWSVEDDMSPESWRAQPANAIRVAAISANFFIMLPCLLWLPATGSFAAPESGSPSRPNLRHVWSFTTQRGCGLRSTGLSEGAPQHGGRD